MVTATLLTYGFVENSTKIFPLTLRDIIKIIIFLISSPTFGPSVARFRTVNLEVHIPGSHLAPDEIFLPIPHLLYGLNKATALEHLDGIGLVSREYYHPLYQASRRNLVRL